MTKQLNTDQLDRLAEIKEEILVLLGEALGPSATDRWHLCHSSADRDVVICFQGGHSATDSLAQPRCRRAPGLLLVNQCDAMFLGLRRPTSGYIGSKLRSMPRLTTFVLLPGVGLTNQAAPKSLTAIPASMRPARAFRRS